MSDDYTTPGNWLAAGFAAPPASMAEELAAPEPPANGEPMYRKILFPTDGSSAAMKAAHVAARLAASQPGCEVVVLTAIHLYDPAEVEFGEQTLVSQNAKIEQTARRVVDTTARLIGEHGIAVRKRIVYGPSISACIAREAEEGVYDLVIMGSRGVGAETDDLDYVGSVAQQVIQRVQVPILVIPYARAAQASAAREPVARDVQHA